ncbi:MAG: PadR family transcriptional regulator [Acidobacteriota bacterium]
MTPTPTPTDIDRHLPLKPVVFHILLALAERDAHGYGVIQAVRERSDGRIQLQTGPFYRHLKKLIDDGLVEESPDRPADDDPRRGAYYRLTTPGREVLAAEADRLALLVSASEALGVRREGR